MIFMQDNAPSYACKYSTAWLASIGFKYGRMMTWPPCSNDLNSIENLWALLKHEIYCQGKQDSSASASGRQWRLLGHGEIKKLTDSMDARLMQVIEKKGGQIGK